MEYDTTLADRAYALAASWDASRSLSPAELAKKFAAEDLSDFSANQVVLFLETLGAQKVYEKEVVEAVEGVYGFNEKANPEIKVRALASEGMTLSCRRLIRLGFRGWGCSSVGSCSVSRRGCTLRRRPFGSGTRAG